MTKKAAAGGFERALVALLVVAAPGCILFGYNLGDYGGTSDGGLTQDGPPPDVVSEGFIDVVRIDGPQDAARDSGDAGVDSGSEGLPPPADAGMDVPVDLGPPDTGVGAPPEVGTPHTVFVTGSQYSVAGLGGLAGADSQCNALAARAGLPGTYLAWLSTDTVSVASRMTQGTGLYVLPDGTLVALDWNHLANANANAPLAHVIDEDETGNHPFAGVDSGGFCPGPTWVWTGTDPGGVSTVGKTCGNWTDGSGMTSGVAGSTVFNDQFWTDACAGGICTGLASLFCVEQ